MLQRRDDRKRSFTGSDRRFSANNEGEWHQQDHAELDRGRDQIRGLHAEPFFKRAAEHVDPAHPQVHQRHVGGELGRGDRRSTHPEAEEF